jgi:hypothetical protein
MARIRSVHPGLFTDEAFAQLTIEKPLAVAFLIGLWCEADDAGVFEWKPLGLKMKVLPGTTADAAELLAILEGLDFIRRFEVAPRAFGVVRNFVKFQRPKKPNDIHPATAEMRDYAGFLPDGRRPHSGTGRPSSGESSEPDPIDGDANPEPSIFLDGASSEPPAPIAPHSSEPVPNHTETPSEIPRQREDGGGRMKDEGGKRKESSSSARAARAQTSPDDDELLAEFKSAAKNNVAQGCANVTPLRRLLSEDVSLDDILSFAASRVSKLARPLENLGNYWLAPEIRAWSRDRRAAAQLAAAQGQATTRDAQVFIAESSSGWDRAVELWRRERHKKIGPPITQQNGVRGWHFSAAMLAAAEGAKPVEAAERAAFATSSRQRRARCDRAAFVSCWPNCTIPAAGRTAGRRPCVTTPRKRSRRPRNDPPCRRFPPGRRLARRQGRRGGGPRDRTD